MKLLFAAAAIAALPLAAHADDDAIEAAVEGRVGYMQMIGINMGTLAGMAKGEIAYDEAAAVKAATNIEALSKYDLPGLYIEGSQPAEGIDTEALPAIWEKSAEFAEDFGKFQLAATGLDAAVAGGQANVGAALGKLGETCKDCHDDFRKK